MAVAPEFRQTLPPDAQHLSRLAIPFPGIRSAMPSSIPGGIVTVKLSSCSTLPLPWHSGQGCSIMLPRPSQAGQMLTRWNRICSFSFRVLRVTRPVPLHAVQVFGATPPSVPVPWHARHETGRFSRTCSSPPLATRSRGIKSSTPIFSPCTGPSRRPG